MSVEAENNAANSGDGKRSGEDGSDGESKLTVSIVFLLEA